MLMYLKELTNKEFKEFSDSFNLKSIYQTVEYGFVMNEQNFDVLFLGLVDNSNCVIAASLILIEHLSKFKYAYAPRGFLLDYNNNNLLTLFTNEVKKYLNKKNIMAIKISPMIIKSIYDKKNNIITNNNYYDVIFNNLINLGYHHLGYNNYFEALKPRYEAIIDLDLPYYILFRNIKKEYRTKIRMAEKNGVEVYKGDKSNLNYLYLQTKQKYPRDLKYFTDLYDHFSRNNDIEFYYTKLNTEKHLKYIQKKYHEYENLTNKINNMLIANKNLSDNSKLIITKLETDKIFDKYKRKLVEATKLLKEHPDGIVTASILIAKNGNEIFNIIDGYDVKYKSLNSKHLLVWKLIEYYSNNNYKKFNLNGITSPYLPNNKYKGLNEFKLNFNALAYEYMGDLELVTNNTLYFMYRNTAPLRSILKK